MSLVYQPVEFPFGTGISDDVAEYARNPPQISQLLNARITKSGSVTPREGYSALGDAFTSPARCCQLKNELYVVDTNGTSSTNNVRAFIKGLQANQFTPSWTKQGGGDAVNALTEAVVLERRPIARDEWAQDDPDVAVDTTSSWIGICWTQKRERTGGANPATRVFAMVLDLFTWAVISPAQEISTGAAAGSECVSPRIIRSTASGLSAFLVVYSEVGTSKIRGRAWNGTSWGTDTVLVNDGEVATGLIWDVACETNVASGDTATGIWYLAYCDTTPRVNLVKFTELTSTTTANIAESPACIGISHNTTDSHLWVGWYVSGTGNVRGACRNSSTLASVLAATTVAAAGSSAVYNIGSCRISANKALFTWTQGGASGFRQRASFKTLTSAGALGTECRRYSIGYLSKPWLVDQTVYAAMHYDGNSSANGSAPMSRDSDGYSTAFTVALTDTGDASTGTPRYSFRSVATWMIGFAGHRRSLSNLGHFRTTSTTNYEFCFAATEEIRQTTVTAGFSYGVNGIGLCRFGLNASNAAGKLDRFRGVEFGGCLVFAGGQTMLFDGSNVSEYGFFWPPENASMTPFGSGGALGAGNYQLYALWEYMLANGDVMRSAPAIVRNSTHDTYATTVASDKLTIVQSPLNLTQKFNATTGGGTEELKSAPLACYYRTEANGGIYYLDSPGTPSQGALSNDIFADDSSALTMTLTTSDASLISHQELYTTGGILPNYPIPATDYLCVHRNRLWWICSEDKKTLGFTHVKQEGEMPQTHPFLTLRLEDGGDCIALASLDDKLIVFKESSIWVVYGGGPDRMGLNSDLQIQRIPQDHGCEERRSIASIPAGIMFRANKGICLLDRKLQVQFVGGPVMDEVTDSYETRAAITRPQDLRVYFLQADLTQANIGFILVYHWDSGQWAIDLIDTESVMPTDGINVANQFYLLGPSSHIYTETGGVDPGGSPYPMGVTTSWIPVGGGKQGAGRCRWVTVMGRKLQDYAATITLAQDRISTTTQTVSLTSSDINAMYAKQPKIHVAQQRCQALRVSILVTGSSDSRCVELTGLMLDIGAKPGVARLPDANMRG